MLTMHDNVDDGEDTWVNFHSEEVGNRPPPPDGVSFCLVGHGLLCAIGFSRLGPNPCLTSSDHRETPAGLRSELGGAPEEAACEKAGLGRPGDGGGGG